MGRGNRTSFQPVLARPMPEGQFYSAWPHRGRSDMFVIGFHTTNHRGEFDRGVRVYSSADEPEHSGAFATAFFPSAVEFNSSFPTKYWQADPRDYLKEGIGNGPERGQGRIQAHDLPVFLRGLQQAVDQAESGKIKPKMTALPGGLKGRNGKMLLGYSINYDSDTEEPRLMLKWSPSATPFQAQKFVSRWQHFSLSVHTAQAVMEDLHDVNNRIYSRQPRKPDMSGKREWEQRKMESDWRRTQGISTKEWREFMVKYMQEPVEAMQRLSSGPDNTRQTNLRSSLLTPRK